jgi:hypothetical protein
MDVIDDIISIETDFMADTEIDPNSLAGESFLITTSILRHSTAYWNENLLIPMQELGGWFGFGFFINSGDTPTTIWWGWWRSDAFGAITGAAGSLPGAAAGACVGSAFAIVDHDYFS